MLDAAAQVLVEEGYANFTVNAVTRRAGASKSTVYSWFGNREGLLQAVVNTHYDRSSEWLRPHPDGPRKALLRFAAALIQSLQDDLAVAITRAAMSAPELRKIQLAGGYGRVQPLTAEFLRQAARAGDLRIDDPDAAAKAFFGLVVQDDQVLRLLGEARLTPQEVRVRAEFAVGAFFRVYAP
ncbi:putative TetR family transcriptional regulator [Gordonia hirsuta DSM 44140 = NBRC 16056]|uniref:Putative TetR family transcriptional regulator n=2 Tax=Gordonia hirsuta TaxID=53427 RepID=L7LCD5_9ACTN|nr:putative TetR family transcriptional regulator [Gordonia hirsuta DSM 44140 = NBRC 16056]